MDKVYVVTEGEYSDYHIEACFSTKEKAQEFIKSYKKIHGSFYSPTIEKYELNGNPTIVDVIDIYFTFTSPFSKNEHKEQIRSEVSKAIECSAFIYDYETELYGYDYDTLKIRRIANPNKSIEDEISRCTKIAYDTAKKIKYLYEVENVKTIEEMRARLNGVE